MNREQAIQTGMVINQMAEHNDIQGIKYVFNQVTMTLEELHRHCPWLDMGYLLVLRSSGDV